MNVSAIALELSVVLLGIIILLADLWIAPAQKRLVGYGAACGLAMILVFSLGELAPDSGSYFGGLFVVDSLAMYFKRFFLLAGLVTSLITLDYSEKIEVGIAEFHALSLFALAGMMLAASSNDLIMMFAALELITVTFFVLNSFARAEIASLEAGVKYLIQGAVASGLMVFGMALVFGTANATSFPAIFKDHVALASQPTFLIGVVLILSGLGFKIAAFPFHMWAPDVYEGAPVPAVALLSVGSKSAGFVLLIRFLLGAIPGITHGWSKIVLVIAALTILYASLCALAQRNVKRLLGYSSIANAGFLLLGIAAATDSGTSSVLFFLGAYAFTVLAIFTVLGAAGRHLPDADLVSFAGLAQRSPILAGALAVGIVSLAGIPPLAGFLGKFLLLKSVLAYGATSKLHLLAVAAAVVGVVLSLYYYFGVLRTMYWPQGTFDHAPIPVSGVTKVALLICVAGVIYLGLAPNALVESAQNAVAVLGTPVTPAVAGASH